VEVS